MCQLKHIRQDKHERYISDKERTLTATNVLCPPNKTVIGSYGQTSFTEEIKINNNNNNINYNNLPIKIIIIIMIIIIIHGRTTLF